MIMILTSCDTSFESNTRLLVKGKVVDSDGNPVENAEISTYTYRGTGFFIYPAPTGSTEYLLGKNVSDANGDFSVISLYDNSSDFSIEIKANEDYSEYIYRTSTYDYTPDDYLINLQEVTLNNLAQATISISRTSGEGNTISYSLNYFYPTCIEVYDEGVLNSAETFCNYPSYINNTLDDNLPDTAHTLNVTQGSEISFTYSINNEPEITEILIVDVSNYQFNFNY
ncbi:dioxygenase family protein [Winogradskyella endarachnes]|uniref:Intradiol ring-cleavage dioxygenases domain-containing protein n=1 Tax=Winogradskyella endarachnes TaxID=2681965 RepID=A0A6L6UF32_9FLAO|nr:hypothetical protein [Winogradskyella endarachnes]MUU79444.1 hypothetical protein [Winogradskyella endarachnes]